MTYIARQTLRNQSASALLWLSVILVLLGLVVISPAGRMIIIMIAVICSGVSTLLCRGRTRTVGIFITVAMLFLLSASYPAYKKHMDLYLERAEEKSATNSAPHTPGEKAGELADTPSNKSLEQPGHE